MTMWLQTDDFFLLKSSEYPGTRTSALPSSTHPRVLAEHLLCASSCWALWGHSDAQNKPGPSSQGSHSAGPLEGAASKANFPTVSHALSCPSSPRPGPQRILPVSALTKGKWVLSLWSSANFDVPIRAQSLLPAPFTLHPTLWNPPNNRTSFQAEHSSLRPLEVKWTN
jgi:hypothetical protein